MIEFQRNMYFLDFKKKHGVSLLPQAYNSVKLGELMFVKHQTRQPLQSYFENRRNVFEFFFKENPFCIHLEPLTAYGEGRA